MDRNSEFFKQVQFLVRLLPLVALERDFALKGGTAINLFVRDMPRLSVDIDLAYLPSDEHEVALKNIRAALGRISAAIGKTFSGAKVQQTPESTDSQRLTIVYEKLRVKIELSPVMRGTVFQPKLMTTSKATRETFGYAEIQVISLPDLYAGKICAALDRQHPRDLFDIKLLLEHEGLTPDLIKAFLVYLISHDKTIAQLLNPTRRDLRDLYENEFLGMAQQEVSLKELEEVREKLIAGVMTGMTKEQKKFLLSFKGKKPQWELLGVEGAKDLPAVRWKMHNLDRMSAEKHKKALTNLEGILFE